MSKNLTIDIGNTLVKMGLFEGMELLTVSSVKADDDLIKKSFLSAIKPDVAVVCSTASREQTRRVIDMVKPICPIMTEVFYKTPMPIRLKYRTPETLGSDRIATAVAAWSRVQDAGEACNVLVIDCGTAITYDLTLADGTFVGGNITPGVEMRFRALHEHTGRLPHVSGVGDVPLLGYDTETAIRSGVMRGVVAEARDIVAEVTREHPNLKVFFTGGQGGFLYSNLKDINSEYIHDLVVEGLNRILLYNQANENC